MCFLALLNNFEYRNVSLSLFGKYTLLIIVIQNNSSVNIFFKSKVSWDIKYFPSLDSFFVDLDEKKLLIFMSGGRAQNLFKLMFCFPLSPTDTQTTSWFAKQVRQ